MKKEEMLDLLNTALSSGNHMLNLLNDILDISKSKYLSHELERNKVIFQSLAFEAIDGMKSLAQSRGIRLHSQIIPNDESKHVIMTDRTKVIQIVSNTVNNAIKFSGQRGIDVKFQLVPMKREALQILIDDVFKPYAGKVFMRREGELVDKEEDVWKQLNGESKIEDDNIHWMYFSVRDHGCGMKPTEISDMFTPYTQSSQCPNSAFQGTGLGLYICLSLCQKLSGLIGCGSTEGRGTTFSIVFPVELCPMDTEIRVDRSRESSPRPELSTVRMYGPVLIIDDNKVNVKILKRSLEIQFKLLKTDFKILSAFGGAEGIALYKEHHPSLVVVDYHMPEVDGIEVTKTIRKYEKEEKVHTSYVISYTADLTEKASKIIFESGADEIMSKPPPRGFLESIALRLRHPNDV
jgi:CheY-like chemotaxis protein